MAGFTSTSDGEWVFDFADPETKPKLPSEPSMATGYLEGPGRWENWSDADLYVCDSLIRQLFAEKAYDPKWTKQSAYYRRYTVGMMFEVLFGRKYDLKTDCKLGHRLARVMGYYSTRIQKSGQIRGKRHSNNVYTLSLSRYNRLPPFSLKLRLEWLESHGKLPTWQNMKLPDESLKSGHARNPRTDENMEKRRERARARYSEQYADRAH